MAKMFYSSKEAETKLGVSADELKTLVTQTKLREFRDGPNVMFKVDQVDSLAADKKKGGSTVAGSTGLSDSGIALAGDTKTGGDAISLADTGMPLSSKDDTKLASGNSATGTSVFGSDEVSPADTAAQTRIQSAIDDQLSLEGVGSGSGLLDLTRESDDTSLGAELLDEIYPGGEKGDSGIASASGIFEQSSPSADDPSSGLEHLTSTPQVTQVAEMVEAADPMAGVFGGLAFAAVLIMIITGVIATAFFLGISPSWVEKVTSSTGMTLAFGGVLVVIAALFAGVGFFASRTVKA